MAKRIALLLVLGVAAAPVVPALGAGKVRSVSVGDFFFKPGALKIKKGTKVKWTWVGMTAHNVTVTSGPNKFHSPTQTSGTYSHTFNQKGTWHLVCTIHGFTMTVKVS